MVIPKRIVEIRPAPVLAGMQDLTILVLEMEDGSPFYELALPTYLFRGMTDWDGHPKHLTRDDLKWHGDLAQP
jgi:hypothetical protein